MGEEEQHKESTDGELPLKKDFGECLWDPTLFFYLFSPVLKAVTHHCKGKGKKSAAHELFLQGFLLGLTPQRDRREKEQ